MRMTKCIVIIFLTFIYTLFANGSSGITNFGATYWPDTGTETNSGLMSSAYGPRDVNPSGYTYDFHRGIDIGIESGSNVYSFSQGSGVVEWIGYITGLERTVVIKHVDNVYSLYGHLSGEYVNEGDEVNNGALLASSGSNHLHFSVLQKWDESYPLEYTYHPMRFLPYDITKNDNTTIENFILDRQNKKVSFKLKVYGDILNCNCVEATLVDTWGNNKEGNSFWYEDWAQYYYDL